MKNGMFGVMLDCSRNAVYKVETVKKFIDDLSAMGYNTLMLYTEDTYEIPNQPRFGYLRGRYSLDELREIVNYGEEKGVELIPCIQTLAHLNQIFRWGEYCAYRDIDDILLIDDDRTYRLIDDMFSAIRSVFKTNRVHIGMDEAHNIGRGRYFDIHGMENRFELISRHLKKVLEIADKYNFKAMMWSDMFFRLANRGNYNVSNPEIITDEIVATVPENVELVYWDYYSDDYNHYTNMIKAHQRFNNPTIFAGGAWNWRGFTPHNKFTIKNTENALKACNDNGVDEILMTVWGDNGNESPLYSVLPSLFYSAQAAQGNFDLDDIKAKFKALFGIGFDDFTKIDLPSCVFENSEYGDDNTDKIMLYVDPLLGIYDSFADFRPDSAELYADYAKQLRDVNAGEYNYLFENSAALCDVLSVKFSLGSRIRKAYQSGDKEALAEAGKDCLEAVKLLDIFRDKFYAAWCAERKSHGFDIQDLRLGGLRRRLITANERINSYLNGDIKEIEELKETILPENPKSHLWWRELPSVNAF